MSGRQLEEYSRAQMDSAGETIGGPLPESNDRREEGEFGEGTRQHFRARVMTFISWKCTFEFQ